MGVGGGRTIFSPLANNLTSRRSKKYGLIRVEVHIYKNCTQHMYDKRLSQPPEVPNRNNKWREGGSGSLSGFWMSAKICFFQKARVLGCRVKTYDDSAILSGASHFAQGRPSGSKAGPRCPNPKFGIPLTLLAVWVPNLPLLAHFGLPGFKIGAVVTRLLGLDSKIIDLVEYHCNSLIFSLKKPISAKTNGHERIANG